MKILMIKKLLNLFSVQVRYPKLSLELYLSKSEDHYDLDYRIKKLDQKNIF